MLKGDAIKHSLIAQVQGYRSGCSGFTHQRNHEIGYALILSSLHCISERSIVLFFTTKHNLYLSHRRIHRFNTVFHHFIVTCSSVLLGLITRSTIGRHINSKLTTLNRQSCGIRIHITNECAIVNDNCIVRTDQVEDIASCNHALQFATINGDINARTISINNIIVCVNNTAFNGKRLLTHKQEYVTYACGAINLTSLFGAAILNKQGATFKPEDIRSRSGNGLTTQVQHEVSTKVIPTKLRICQHRDGHLLISDFICSRNSFSECRIRRFTDLSDICRERRTCHHQSNPDGRYETLYHFFHFSFFPFLLSS